MVLQRQGPMSGNESAKFEPKTPRTQTRMNGIERVLQILDELADKREGMRVSELALAIGAPLSTVYSLADFLVTRDILTRDNDGALWLGPKLLHYGFTYQNSIFFLPLAEQEIRLLSEQVSETVQICGRDGDQMVILGMADGPGPFTLTSRKGTRVPLNWTASGRLLTGHLPFEERVDLYRRSAVPSPTGNAETDPEKLARAADEALKVRLSIQLSEVGASVACIAAPIMSTTGQCLATVSIVLPPERVKKREKFYVSAVQECAQRIEYLISSRQEGHRECKNGR